MCPQRLVVFHNFPSRRCCPHCPRMRGVRLSQRERFKVSQVSSCFLSRWERTKVRVSSSLYTGYGNN
jgi:hypothetical protein